MRVASFPGRIWLSGLPDSAVGVVIDLTDDRVVVRTDATVIGDWPRGQVEASTGGDGVHLKVEGEELVFDGNRTDLFTALIPSPNGPQQIDERIVEAALPTIIESPSTIGTPLPPPPFHPPPAAAELKIEPQTPSAPPSADLNIETQPPPPRRRLRDDPIARGRHVAHNEQDQASAATKKPWWKTPWFIGSALVVVVAIVANAGEDLGSLTSLAATTTLASALVTITELPSPSPTLPRPDGSVPNDQIAQVVSVVDGDTIRVEFADGKEEPVRLIGIDSPESGALADRATDHLEALINGQAVVLVTDVSDRDRFDRLLRYVYRGALFVNEEMVRSGFAIAKQYEPDLAMTEVLETAQAYAERYELGQWAAETTATDPVLLVAPTTAGGACHPSYRGECVPVNVSDVDCEGGTGDGPYYVGEVEVVGPDVYNLDRDSDGIACVSS